MRRPTIRSGHGGFTLIEIMVAIAIVGILLMVGAPALGTYLANSRVKAAAQSFASGLQAARTEAVRRNQPVQFIITNDANPVANFGSVAATSTGAGWVVRFSSDAQSNPPVAPFNFVDGKAASEGSGAGTAPRIAIAATAGGSGVSDVIFRPLGDTNLGAVLTIAISDPGSTCQTASGGTVRCLNVQVSPGGRVQVCDPLAATTDTRSCL